MCAVQIYFLLLVIPGLAKHAPKDLPKEYSAADSTLDSTMLPLTTEADFIPQAIALALKEFLHNAELAQTIAHRVQKNPDQEQEIAERLTEVLDYNMVSGEEALRIWNRVQQSNKDTENNSRTISSTESLTQLTSSPEK